MKNSVRKFGDKTLSEAINEAIIQTIDDFFASHGCPPPATRIEVESVGVSGYQQRTFKREHYLTIKIDGI